VKVFVRDQEASLRFYVDQLGFDLTFDAQLQTGERWLAVSPRDGSTVLTLIAPAEGSKEHELIGRDTGVVLVAEDVVAQYTEWRKREVRFLFAPRLRRLKYERRQPHPGGAAVEPHAHSPVWGGVFTRFKDIDGNSFALVGFDEVNREIEAQRRSQAEKVQAERRAAQELEIATQVQARLFPQTQPAIESLDYAGVCIQARQVGGDYHDFLQLGRGRYGLVIADISGKGMAAALLMANLQANIRSQCAIALDQTTLLLESVNRLFCENTADTDYATMFFAEYDDAARKLRYANCGHLPGLLLRSEGQVEHLHSTCPVLGLFKQWDCCLAESYLSPGDVLLLYTDGVTESFDDAEAEFGEARLLEALERFRALAPADAVAAIVDEVRRFSPREMRDDITLIMAKCRAAAGSSLPLF
jgi:serine phosphatase RsbU (regulator of sigma subunit)